MMKLVGRVHKNASQIDWENCNFWCGQNMEIVVNFVKPDLWEP